MIIVLPFITSILHADPPTVCAVIICAIMQFMIDPTGVTFYHLRHDGVYDVPPG